MSAHTPPDRLECTLPQDQKSKLKATLNRSRRLMRGEKRQREDIVGDVLRLLGQYARLQKLRAERESA